MIRTTLNRRSSFFVDAYNVVFHTDLFLFNELFYRVSEGDTLLADLFHKSFSKNSKYFSSPEKDVSIIQQVSGKSSQNILYDLIDKEKYNESGFDKPIEEFVAMLYYEFLTNPTCPEYLQMTEFGKILKILATDANFDKLYLYLPFRSEFVYSSIVDSFNGEGISKLFIVSGDKATHINSQSFDTFVFENVTDVDEYLFGKTKKRVEVLIPAYEYNMKEDRTNLEKLVEQVTYRRFNLNLTPNEYTSKGIIISGMSVPI